ncbi:MAG: four helix bundle protein [Deltaproteobacteria bacterium]|nr:four helix bundle protein [Deltaproteobacteria bacterium]
MKNEDDICSFQGLKAWGKSLLFDENVIRAIDELNAPRKHYRLLEQLESATPSIAMNIAKGSVFETVTLLMVFQNLNWLKAEKVMDFQRKAEGITKMLNSLIKSMK